MLADYRRKQSEAEKVAESIIANAREEAERLAVEAKAKVEDFVARRTKMAETKIAQAEAQAVADVRAAATDAAVAAAEKMLMEKTRGRAAENLSSIKAFAISNRNLAEGGCQLGRMSPVRRSASLSGSGAGPCATTRCCRHRRQPDMRQTKFRPVIAVPSRIGRFIRARRWIVAKPCVKQVVLPNAVDAQILPRIAFAAKA